MNVAPHWHKLTEMAYIQVPKVTVCTTTRGRKPDPISKLNC